MEALDRIKQLEETIAKAKKEAEELKAEYLKSKPPAKWKPSWTEGKETFGLATGKIPWNLSIYNANSVREKHETGFAYETKQQAATVMHSLNQLALLWAYKYEVEPDWEPNWNLQIYKYRIAYNIHGKRWSWDANVTTYIPFIPYFSSREIVEELCCKLNSGEFDLFI